MLGGRWRMEKLAAVAMSKRFDPSLLVTHNLSGFDKVEEGLMLMKDKPKDLIKPLITI